MPKYYPGWIMRLYTDYDIEDTIYRKLCNMACHHSNLDICHVKDLPGTPFSDASKFFPMNWRFFPTMDPQVGSYTYLSIFLIPKLFHFVLFLIR